MPHNDNSEGSSRFLLGQVLAEQRATNARLDDFISTSRASDGEHSDRLMSLEASRYKTVGAAGVISALFGVISMWWSNK